MFNSILVRVCNWKQFINIDTEDQSNNECTSYMSVLFKSKLELDSGPFLGPEVKTRHLSQSCPQNSPLQLPLGVGGCSLTKPIYLKQLLQSLWTWKVERCGDQKVPVRNHAFQGRSITDLSESSDCCDRYPFVSETEAFKHQLYHVVPLYILLYRYYIYIYTHINIYMIVYD